MKTTFSIFISLLIGSSAFGKGLTFDADVPVKTREQMTRDLDFMYSIKGSLTSKLHTEIFGSMDGDNYKNFFEERILFVGLGSCGSAGKPVACVRENFQNKMWLTNYFTDSSYPEIARMLIIFHEARHAESIDGSWPHDICPTPFLDDSGADRLSIFTGAKLEGHPACDRAYEGSYGISAILFGNISRYCLNCSDKVKMDAKIYSDDQSQRIIGGSFKEKMTQDLNP